MAIFDNAVAVGLALLGLLVGLVLHQKARSAPIVVALFLSTGITAVVYFFLGGIDAVLNAKGVKLTGSMAALVIITVLINRALVKQSAFFQLSAKTFEGDWTWDYPDEGWRGVLNFVPKNGGLSFTGKVEKLPGKEQRGIGTIVYRMTEGEARIVDARFLVLQCTVEDVVNNDKFQWRTTEPMSSGFEFAGALIADKPEYSGDRWGVSLHKAIYKPGLPNRLSASHNVKRP